KSSYQEKITLYESTFSKARRILEIEQPDIVYQRVLNSFSYRISTFTNRRSIPYILHVADNYSVTFKGLKNNIKKLIFKRIVNNKPRIIVQTKVQKDLISSITDIEALQIPNFHPVITKTPTIK